MISEGQFLKFNFEIKSFVMFDGINMHELCVIFVMQNSGAH